ncbi:hypothetical protein [Burkholderia phage FLC9]|nr:hypothetical protein [Burkholderia phage FLC9]
MKPEDDPHDPYILGQPMGRVATAIFVIIMFAVPIGSEIWTYLHPNTNASVQGTRK